MLNNKKLSTKERTELKLFNLDSYCLMITSKYFNSLEDFKNIELSSPKYKENMEKFHFNPISITKEELKYFPRLETLHLYNENDELIEGGEIKKYIIEYKVTYGKYLQMKEENKNKIIEFKKVLLTTEDFYNENNKHYKETGSSFIEYEIPEIITEVEYDCFVFNHNLTKLTYKNPKWQVHCDRIFNNESHLCSFQLSKDLQIINDKQYNHEYMFSYEIPQFVTSLGDYCFAWCEITDIQLPENLKSLGRCTFSWSEITKIVFPNNLTQLKDYCLANCLQLEEITFNNNIKEIGKGCFMDCPEVEENEIIKKSAKNQIWSTENEMNKLEEWTGMNISNTVFDSENDHWDWFGRDEFGQQIKDKEHLIFLIENDRNIKFGVFISSRTEKIDYEWISDENAFAFTFRNNNPMKFDIIKERSEGIFNFDDGSKRLFEVGCDDISIGKQGWGGAVHQHEHSCFDYKGIENALIGECEHGYFGVRRILVIQMKK